MSLPLIPHIRVPVVGASVCADPWYTWFQAVQQQVAVSVDVDTLVSEIATKLGSPDGSIAGIPTPSDTTGNVLGLKSLQSFGTLAEGQVTLTLRGDVSVPGATEYYGSNATGQRGWHAVAGAMAQGVGLTLTVGADGVTTFDLADLADSGTGSFKLLTRDAQGRLSGTADGDTDDVPEGAGNLYYTDVRADGRITAQKGQPNGLATLDASSKLDAGQLPALAITETSVVADEAAMLALTAQQGDVAVRTDLQTSFILTTEPASTLANWQELLTPTAGAVTSFNGRTGAVVPATGDYTPAQVGADPAGTAAAIVAATITNGDTTHAPSGDAVFDALAVKAVKSEGALVSLSVGQSLASGATDAVLFDVEAYDDNGYHSGANPARLTAPVAGRYVVSFVFSVQGSASGVRLAYVNRNGAPFTGRPIQRVLPNGVGTDYITATSAPIPCAAGDYFELMANQTSGGSLTIASGPTGTWLSIARVD